MKKILFLLLVIFHTINLFSQNEQTKDTTLTDFQIRVKEYNSDFKERGKADQNPIIKVIKDTLDSDSLVQYYYHNGNLYYQITFKNGKENGWQETYHPNGQFNERRFYVDGFVKSDKCSYVSYDRYGNISYTSICAIYNKKQYSFKTTYFDKEPFSLMVYNTEAHLVAEFKYWNDKWEKYDYHVKSVRYANKLLKVYLGSIPL
jgi:hypothetical protein